MAKSDVSAVTNYFPTVNEGFITTTGGTVTSGAATISLTSAAGLDNGSIFVGIIEPGLTKEQVFTGTVDTAGVQITGVKWTRGTNADHSAGVTIVDYVTGTGINMMNTGILKFANQTGTLKTAAVQAALGIGTEALNGWTALGYAPNTVTCNGNRSYTLTFNSVDLTGTISPGMRLRTTRTVNATTQSTSLDGSTQYYSKSSPSGMTFTDDFTVSAWVKLSSYPAADVGIVSRTDGTQGWLMAVNASGQVYLSGYNGALVNYSRIISYQSLPLNKWVHIAAQLDMSTFTSTTTTSYVMFNGVDVPASSVRSGTNPTALVQAGNLNIGAYNGGSGPFPGKIAQVSIYSAKVTQANVLATISQKLSGSETNQISAYSFNNAITDLNANANNLTANGSAVATNADSPFGNQADGTISATLDYCIVQKTAYSSNTTVTVQVPEGCTIPTTGGVSAVSYATNKSPFGMPVQLDKWRLVSIWRADTNSTSNATYGAFSSGGWALTVPIGSWNIGVKATLAHSAAVIVTWNIASTALTGLSEAAGANASPYSIRTYAPTGIIVWTTEVRYPQTLAAASTYVMYTFGASTAGQITGSVGQSEIFAECSLL